MTDIRFTPSSRRFPYELVLVVLLTACMAAITAPRVFTAPLWGDELRTWRDGIEKPLSMVLLWHHDPDHAPLGHLMARAGAAIFGVDRPWALRLGSWLCALLCVRAIWLFGRSLSSDKRIGQASGLLMSLMLVVDPSVGFQATQARMYTLLLLCSITALTAATKLLRRSDDLSDGGQSSSVITETIVLALALAVGIWTHAPIYAVIAPMLMVAAGLTVLRSARVKRFDSFAMPVLIAILIALAIGAQGVLKLIHRRDANPLDVEEPAAPLAQLEDATRALSGANWISGLIIAIAIMGLVVIGRRNRAVAWLFVGVIVMALANLLFAARYRPVAFARYLIVMQPALWACTAALIVELWGFVARLEWQKPVVQVARGGIVAGVVALCAFELSRDLQAMPAHPVAAPFRDAIHAVEEEQRRDPSLRVVVLPRPPYAMFARYYGLLSDDAVFDVIAAHVPREREKGHRLPPTTDEASQVTDTTPITVVGLIPERGNKERTAEDPLAFTRALANMRGLTLPDIPTPDGTLRVVAICFHKGRVDVTDAVRPPMAPGRHSPHALQGVGRADGSAARQIDRRVRRRCQSRRSMRR